MHYETNNAYYVGWQEDPRRDPPLIPSSKKQWKTFLRVWKQFVEYNKHPNPHYYPYMPTGLSLLDEIWYKAIGYQIDDIEYKLNIIEKELLKAQNQIDKCSLVYSHFGIPIHLMGMIMNLKV